jgi:hypothetical protein
MMGYSCKMSRIPHCLDNPPADGGEIISLTRPPRFTPQKYFLVFISIRGSIIPRTTGRQEGFDKLKNSMTCSGIEPMTSGL